MITKDTLCDDINRHAATNVSMHGDVDDNGIYSGHVEGSSPDEIYEFLRYVAVTRGRDFDSVDIRYGQRNPPTFTCYVEFDAREIEGKEGYIITPCKQCGTRVQAEPNLTGCTGNCPNCGTAIAIGSVRVGPPPLPKTDSNPDTPQPVPPHIDISQLYFRSTDHKRYNSGVPSGGDNRGCNRAIEIKPDTQYDESYFVTLCNLDGVHPDWGDNIQIAPKRMKVVMSSKDTITLRGYGADPMLAGRPPQIQENYGITLHLKDDAVDHISYHYHDRNVRIDFLK